jgi:Uma2 family endonuclease
MSTIVEKKYTPDDLLAMPDAKNFELVDGHLVERNVSQLSSWVAGELFGDIRAFLKEKPLGWVWPSDLGYECFPDSPGKVRRADVSFIRRERLPQGPTSEGYAYIAPDLAVEVVSPNDLAYEVERKVVEYLDAGVSLVWVINPEARTILIRRRNGTVDWLREHDELRGEDVLPGFVCRVSSLFPETLPAAAANSTD